MFTPQRKSRPGIAFTPNRVPGSGSSPRLDKGKAVSFADEAPPPLRLLGGTADDDEAENMEDWRKFREEGLLDEASIQRRDNEALVQNINKLQRELHDYQYTMGLLLMEKDELATKFNDLSQVLGETQEILKREQSTRLIALSEAEEREENLRQALAVEKQCVTDLEKALRRTCEEGSHIKDTSDKKLAEASGLVGGIDEKSLEVQEKLHAAEAKFAEANRKSSELEMKLQELEYRESVLQKERLSLTAERDAHKETFYKEREHLREWERKLQDGENRLSESRRILNEKEQEVGDKEKIFSQKDRALEETQKNVHLSNCILKDKDDEINIRLANLSAKEKKVDSLRSILDMKEKELIALEGKLTARERVEIQKILDDHKAILNLKKDEFELDLEEKRRAHEVELKSKVDAVEQLKLELNHNEEKLKKREQALEKKSERVREKERDNETKLKTINEQEKLLNNKDKKLDAERQQLLADKRSLEILKDEIERINEEVSKQKLQIKEEEERLRITENERSEHLVLQSELKQELEKCRLQGELLLKEGEDLKQERDKFEREWEILDEKRVEINHEQGKIDEEKQNLEKFQHSEQEKLDKEKQAFNYYKDRELEVLRLEKESFTATMRHEEALLAEKLDKHSQTVKDLELQRRDVDLDLQNRREELDKRLRERGRELQDQHDKELGNINYLKVTVQKEMEEVENEKCKIAKDKEELKLNREQLNKDRLDLRKDIDDLVTLSRKLKHQREQLVKERRRFLEFVENHNSCKEGGDITRDFVMSELPELGDEGSPSLPSLGDEFLNNASISPGDIRHSDSGGHMSLLRKCAAKIFKLSPIKMIEPDVASNMVAYSSPLSCEQVYIDREAEGPSTHAMKDAAFKGHLVIQDERQPSSKIVNNLIDVEHSKKDETEIKAQDAPEDSQQSELKSGRKRPVRKHKSALNRTRSVKEVVKEAKSFLGKNLGQSDLNDNVQTADSCHANEESQFDSGCTEKAGRKTARKRERAARVTESEQGGGDSEGCSDSVTTGKRRKRRQPVDPVVQTPGERRYNLRRHRPSGNVAAAQASSDTTKKDNKRADSGAIEVAAASKENALPSSTAAGENDNNTSSVEVTTVKRIVTFDRRVDVDDKAGAAKSVETKAGATKSVETVPYSEEADGTPEYGNDVGAEEEDSSAINDEDDLDDYSEQPGEASIGKKLWTFFTT